MSGRPAHLPLVIYEGPGARPIDPARKLRILCVLLGKGYTLSTAACPCQLSDAAGAGGPMAVLGLFEGPMPQRLEQDGTSLLFREIDGLEDASLLEAVGAAGAAAVSSPLGPPEGTVTEPPGKWIPWFPVIDRGRCNECGKCLSFCLFGVYEAEGRRVRVARPESCKTNCPACARVCPRCAIIFPKHKEAPIDGSPVRPEDLPKDGDKVASVLRQNIHQLLRSRSMPVNLGPPGPAGGGRKDA
jgi:NAD-dependent dihydropyrimidine dehydrogenase PreA subunit